MAENPTTASRVLDALVVSGVLTTGQLAEARGAAEASGRHVGDVLLESGTITDSDVERALEHELGVPSVDLASYAPDEAALELVPLEVARKHGVLPLFEIEGALTVAIGSMADVFDIDDVAIATGLEIEVVRSDPASVREAIEQCYAARRASGAESIPGAVVAYTEFPESHAWDVLEPSGEQLHVETVRELTTQAQVDPAPGLAEQGAGTLPAGLRPEPQPEPEIGFVTAPAAESDVWVEADLATAGGQSTADASRDLDELEMVERPVEPPAVAAAIDFDVLAVADTGRVAVLVADILELAVKRGASHVHVLPYKDEFFVALRVGGKLEQVGHAARSFEAALIDGFKAYARLSPTMGSAPVLGRSRAEIAGRPITLIVSAVSTITGQRLVVTLKHESAPPPAFDELGMAEADAQSLAAVVERGRGLVFVAAPIGAGMESTYAALIARAARAGRTVYSVERSFGYEIASVAQVVVAPGDASGAAACLQAGLEQDTDVIALDFARSAEEVEIAVQAATAGKLAIVSLHASGAMDAVKRALELGVEPVGLASVLALVVAQRTVRTVCPGCAVLQSSALAAAIPGADPQMIAPVGAGCDACGNTGFGAAIGLFEVLSLTAPARAAIARAESQAKLEAVAQASGMRPMLAVGLGKLREGLVSAEELDRVFRFSE